MGKFVVRLLLVDLLWVVALGFWSGVFPVVFSAVAGASLWLIVFCVCLFT